MPVVALAPLPKIQFFDNNGLPLALGKVYTYQTGTTTPLATYTDSTGATPNTNPVVLDAYGRANIWIGPQAYTFSVTTAAGTVLYTIDGISAQNMPIQAAIHFSAQAAPSAGAGDYYLWADSTGLRLKFANNGTIDTIVGQNTTDTLTNKTLTSPTITSPAISSPAITGGITTNLLPDADLTRALGDATHRWNARLGTATAKIFNGSVYNIKEYGAVGDGTTDDSTAIQAAFNAANAAGGGIVVMPPPPTAYAFSTQLDVPNNVTIEGAGQGFTILRWTGATNGTAISINGKKWVRLRGFTLTTDKAGTTIGILIKSSDQVDVKDVGVHGYPTEYITTGFGTAVRITGDGASTYCNDVTLQDMFMRGWQTAGIWADHTNEIVFQNLRLPQIMDSVTGTALILDTAAVAIYMDNVSILYGLNGMKVQDAGGGGAYGGAPTWLFAHKLIVDTVTGGDGILFDSSLATKTIGFMFNGCWASKCGLNTAGSVITATATGINYQGGKDIIWTDGRIFNNAIYGIYINNTDGGFSILGGQIRDNNQSNGAGISGIKVAGAAPNLRIIGNRICNGVGTGHQKYGIAVDAVSADQLVIANNDLNGNETAPLLNQNTGVSVVSGNMPVGANCLANVDLTAQGAAIGTTTLYAVPANGAGQYRLMWDAKVTTPATTGAGTSTLGALTIVYTDPDGVAQTITAPASIAAGTIATTSATNTTAAVLLGLPLLLNCKASTNITYAMAYASDTAGQMKYNLHIKLIEAL